LERNLAQHLEPDHSYYKHAGIVLILAGLVYILDQVLHTGWLTLMVLPALGLWGFIQGIRYRRRLWAIPGSLVAGLGLGGYFLLVQTPELPTEMRFGWLLFWVGAGFLGIFGASWGWKSGKAYWALLPGLIFIGGALPFLFNHVQILEFVFYLLVAIGLALLIWGMAQKLIGLLIPACLLLGIGPGIYFSWSQSTVYNGLTETGAMLVWFALGWGLITIVMRVVSDKFIWWPLIPGGLLAVVGWGLYIGGDPGNALAFIGNTGSIGLIIFGVYLLLLRRGFKG
jgi:hypothetical protein